MACGERFAFLLPPPCQGYGLGLLCSGEDYEVARLRVDEIRRRLIRAWNETVRVENAAAEWPVTNKHRTEHDAWLARHDDLGWQLIASKSDFEAVETLARDGVCLLDRMLADAEAAYGDGDITIPEEPYTPPPEPGVLDQAADLGRSAVTVAAIAAIGFAVYKVWDRYG